MKMARLTFLASMALVLASGLGTGDVEAREKVPIEKVVLGDDDPSGDGNGDTRGGLSSAGAIRKARGKQITELSEKRRGLRDQLDQALQRDDLKQAKKVAAALRSVERQLVRLVRVERESRQASDCRRQPNCTGCNDCMASSAGRNRILAPPALLTRPPRDRSQLAPGSGGEFDGKKPPRCKGCGTRHGKPHCPTFGTNPDQRGDVLRPIDCICDGVGCGYCSPDGVPPDGRANVSNRPNLAPVLLTRPPQDRSELAPGSGGELDGKKRKRCLTCGKKHKIYGGKCPSVGDGDLPNSQNVRPVGRGGSSRPSRSTGLFSRSGRSGLSTRGINRSVPVRQSRSTSRPIPVRRPKSTSRSVPVRRPRSADRPNPSRRPRTRASQNVKPVRRPR